MKLLDLEYTYLLFVRHTWCVIDTSKKPFSHCNANSTLIFEYVCIRYIHLIRFSYHEFVQSYYTRISKQYSEHP